MSEEQAVAESGITTRRALLAGAGGLGATAVLTACGTDPDEDTPAGGNPTGGSTGDAGANSDSAGSGALAKTSDIPVEGGVILAAQSVVVTQPKDGVFKCFTSICTHQGCPVTAVENGTINCNCHGSKFSIEDGSVKNGPASKALTERQIKVDSGSITLA
jgi:Rieske Fe-S protein